MTPKQTLQERENALRLLLATPVGRKAIEDLACQYSKASRRLRPAGTSAITYILIHEREQGVIRS
jgi:hypothetical protein